MISIAHELVFGGVCCKGRKPGIIESCRSIALDTEGLGCPNTLVGKHRQHFRLTCLQPFHGHTV